MTNINLFKLFIVMPLCIYGTCDACLFNEPDKSPCTIPYRNVETDSFFKHSHVPDYKDLSLERQTSLGELLLQEAKRGNLGAFLRLLKEGASVHVSDSQGNTALHYAALGNTYIHRRMVEYLLSFGAVPDRRNNDGETAIHYAAATPVMLLSFVGAAQTSKTYPMPFRLFKDSFS